MALMIDLQIDPNPDPKDYGLKDFYHNNQGQVDYAYFFDSSQNIDLSDVQFPSREEQRYKEDCTDTALDNLMFEREQHANRCRFNKEYEQWLNEWN